MEDEDGYSSCDTSSSSSCATRDAPMILALAAPAKRRGGRRPIATKTTEIPIPTTAEEEQQPDQKPAEMTTVPPPGSPAKNSAPTSPSKSPTKRKNKKSTAAGNDTATTTISQPAAGTPSTKSKVSLDSFFSSPSKSRSPAKKKKDRTKDPKSQGIAEAAGAKQETTAAIESPTKAKKSKRTQKPPSIPSPTKSPAKSPTKKKKDAVIEATAVPPQKKGAESPKKPAKKVKKHPENNLLEPQDNKLEATAATSSPSKSKKGKSPVKNHRGKISSAPSTFWDKPDAKLREYDDNSSGREAPRGALNVFVPGKSVLDDPVTPASREPMDRTYDPLLVVDSSDEGSSSDDSSEGRTPRRKNNELKDRQAKNGDCLEHAAQPSRKPRKRLTAFGSDDSSSSGGTTINDILIRPQKSPNQANPAPDTSTSRKQRLTAFGPDDSSSSGGTTINETLIRPQHPSIQTNQAPGTSTSRKKRLTAFGSDDSSSSGGTTVNTTPIRQQHPSTQTKQTPNTSQKSRISAFGPADDSSSGSETVLDRRDQGQSDKIEKNSPSALESATDDRNGTDSDPVATDQRHRKPGKRLSAFGSGDSSESSSSENTRARRSDVKPSALSRSYSGASTDSEPPISLGLRPGRVETHRPSYRSSSDSEPDSAPGSRFGERQPDQSETNRVGVQRTFSTESTDSEPPFSLSLRPGATRAHSNQSTDTDGPPISLGLRPGNPSRMNSASSTDSEPPFSLGFRPWALRRMASTSSIDSSPPFSLSMRPGGPRRKDSAKSDHPNAALSNTHCLVEKRSEDPEAQLSVGLRPVAHRSQELDNNNRSEPGFTVGLRPVVQGMSGAVGGSAEQSFAPGLRPVAQRNIDPTHSNEAEEPFSVDLRPVAQRNIDPANSNEAEDPFPVDLRPIPPRSNDSSIMSNEAELPFSVDLRPVAQVGKAPVPKDSDLPFPVRLRPVPLQRTMSTGSIDSSPPISYRLRPVQARRRRADPPHLANNNNFMATEEEQAQAIMKRRSPLKRVASISLKDAVTLEDRRKFLGEPHEPGDDEPNAGVTSIDGNHEKSKQSEQPSNTTGGSAMPLGAKACFDLVQAKRPPPKRTVSKTLENIMPLEERVGILATGGADDQSEGSDNLLGNGIFGESAQPQSADIAIDQRENAEDERSDKQDDSILHRRSEEKKHQDHGHKSITFHSNDNSESTTGGMLGSNFHEIRERLSHVGDSHQKSNQRSRRHSSFLPQNPTSGVNFEDESSSQIDEKGQSLVSSDIRKNSETAANFSASNNQSSLARTAKPGKKSSYDRGHQSLTFNDSNNDSTGLDNSFGSNLYAVKNRVATGRVSQFSETNPNQRSRRHSSFLPQKAPKPVSQFLPKPSSRTFGEEEATETEISMHMEDIYENTREVPLAPNKKYHASLSVFPTQSINKNEPALGGSEKKFEAEESFHFAELRRIAMGAAPEYAKQQKQFQGRRRHTGVDMKSAAAAASVAAAADLQDDFTPVKQQQPMMVGFTAQNSKNDQLPSAHQSTKTKNAGKPFGTTAAEGGNSKSAQSPYQERFSKSLGDVLRNNSNDDDAAPEGKKKTAFRKANVNDDESVMTYECQDVLTSFSQQRKLAMQRARASAPKGDGLSERLKMLNLQG